MARFELLIPEIDPFLRAAFSHCLAPVAPLTDDPDHRRAPLSSVRWRYTGVGNGPCPTARNTSHRGDGWPALGHNSHRRVAPLAPLPWLISPSRVAGPAHAAVPAWADTAALAVVPGAAARAPPCLHAHRATESAAGPVGSPRLAAAAPD